MASAYQVSLAKLMTEFKFQPIYLPKPVEEIFIRCSDVNRPGLQLAGFFEVFDQDRLQVLGKSEMVFMERYTEEEAAKKYMDFFAAKPPAVIIARDLPVPPSMVTAAQANEVALLVTDENTSTLLALLISKLNVELAPRITRHGVFVEVYGEGILIVGDSGVGKSETAIELIKRGHRLVADDAVEMRRTSAKKLIGSSPENIRHFIELRGIGIINARRIFGMASIKMSEEVGMIVQLEHWNSDKVYDRMGLEEQTTDILGVKVPSITIPVTPGRNLAVIIEVAAMNHRQKMMGYNAAEELLQRLGMSEVNTDWDSF